MEKNPEEKITNIFSRQYKRMETELKEISIPTAYLTIISKYWSYCEKDIKGITENGNGLDKNFNR